MRAKRSIFWRVVATSLGLIVGITGGGQVNLISDMYAIWHLRHHIIRMGNTPPFAWRLALALGRPVVARTSLYDLEIETVKLDPVIGLAGGAIESLGDGLLVATPHGRLATIAANGVVEYLEQRVPMNVLGHELLQEHFRVTDILLKEHSPRRFELFVTHHYFTGECFLFRLSSTTLLLGQDNITVSPSWRTIFDAEPCLTSPSVGMSGGKMLTDSQTHLLITIGTHGSKSLSNEADSHFGKVVRVEIGTGEGEIFTSGHRNPQGFVRDEDGKLWLTEHGPVGGDELNLLEPGRHYGWPHVTYGTVYNRKSTNQKLGQHDGFTQPMFAWIPSIGISAVIVNNQELFPLWGNDLLIASLWGGSHGASIFRIRRYDKKVQYVERMEIGHQIRDITHMRDGRLALLLEFDRVLFLRPSKRDDHMNNGR